MQRVATVMAVLAAATLVAGCGGHESQGQVRLDAGAGQFNVLSRGDALPEGHPPVAGYDNGLPPGHPVCPAGRQQLERGTEDGPGGFDNGPQLIST